MLQIVSDGEFRNKIENLMVICCLLDEYQTMMMGKSCFKDNITVTSTNCNKTVATSALHHF